MKDSKVEVFLSSIYEPLYRYISMFANKNDIEDIIQKSMLAFVSKYNYEEIENPKALITKISRNFVKQNYRKRSYEDQAMSMYCTINNEDVLFENFEQDVVDRISSKAIMDVIKKLPCEYRNILVEVYVNNKTIQEIAEEYGESKYALYARRNKAISVLREHISSMGNIF